MIGAGTYTVTAVTGSTRDSSQCSYFSCKLALGSRRAQKCRLVAIHKKKGKKNSWRELVEDASSPILHPSSANDVIGAGTDTVSAVYSSTRDSSQCSYFSCKKSQFLCIIPDGYQVLTRYILYVRDYRANVEKLIAWDSLIPGTAVPYLVRRSWYIWYATLSQNVRNVYMLILSPAGHYIPGQKGDISIYVRNSSAKVCVWVPRTCMTPGAQQTPEKMHAPLVAYV